MPTGSEHPAAGKGDAEASRWASLAAAVRAIGASVTPPPATERDVTGFDPAGDLARRAARWGYELPDESLGALARLTAGLAAAEAAAWREDRPHHATRAYEDRRFLVSDRIVHWAVPWLDAAGRCHPAVRDEAMAARDLLLDLGENLRVAPDLAGSEGLSPPGEDAFGPVEAPGGLEARLGGLGSGVVVFAATITSLRGSPVASPAIEASWLSEPGFRRDLAFLYEAASARWRALAASRPGSARLWLDLGARAEATARLLHGDAT
jgi:hypothetical protein